MLNVVLLNVIIMSVIIVNVIRQTINIDATLSKPFRYIEDKSVTSNYESVIPVIAPQLRVASEKVEDIQLCYPVKLPDGILKVLKLSPYSQHFIFFLIYDCLSLASLSSQV